MLVILLSNIIQALTLHNWSFLRKEPLEGTPIGGDLVVEHRLGCIFLCRPGIRNFSTPSVFWISPIKEGIITRLSPGLRPVLSVVVDATMSEEESFITKFTEVEWTTELDISYMDKIAAEAFRRGPTPDFVKCGVLRYALELLVPHDPTSGAICQFFVLFLIAKMTFASEF